MTKYKPKYYIEERFEKVIKFGENDIRSYQYEQPVQYCNGKQYWEYDTNSYEKQNWGKIYWDSYEYNKCLKYSRYGDKYWGNNIMAMDAAFEKIYTKPKNKNDEGVYTPLMNFEIWLMCNGYEMIYSGKMCSQEPDGRVYHNKIKDKEIIFGFGLKNEYLSINFYFYLRKIGTSNILHQYQCPYKEEDFEKAENGLLPTVYEMYIMAAKEKNSLKQKI